MTNNSIFIAHLTLPFISSIKHFVFLSELSHKSYSLQQSTSPTRILDKPVSFNLSGNLVKLCRSLSHLLHLLSGLKDYRSKLEVKIDFR